MYLIMFSVLTVINILVAISLNSAMNYIAAGLCFFFCAIEFVERRSK
jgi:hypothetical protein